MINKNCPLVMHGVYSYDIVSAYPEILSKQFYDFKDVDLYNKEERSIFIGKQQRGNQTLSQFLIQSADSLVKFYLQDNDVSEDEIITTQRDGFIIKKILDNDDQFITMKFRGYIDFLIISSDRDNFLYLEDGELIIKGMPYYYDALMVFYKQFANLNFYNKKILFKQMQYIKDMVVNSTEVLPFLIPRDEESYIVITYKGNIQIKDPDYIDPRSIDRLKYFNHYFRGFLRSIYLEC
jgi:hypothetical protein